MKQARSGKQAKPGTPAAPAFNQNALTQQQLDEKLLEALSRGSNSIQEMQTLLAAGADPNAVNKNNADCLTMAVLLKNTAAVYLLLDHQANVHYTGFKGGKTALMWAAHMGEKSIVVRLLDAGADPLLTSDNGKNAMDWADDNNKITVREIIRDFIHDRDQQQKAAVQATEQQSESDAFDTFLKAGLPLDHDVKPMKTIRFSAATRPKPE